jgi:hypothetical protein
MAALREQSAAALTECGEKFPPGNPKIAVARAQCVNAAFAILQPTIPYPDLLQVYVADHLAIAEDVQGWPDINPPANAILARKWSEVVAEEQRRGLANRAVSAQEHSDAAASWRASGPRTCNYGAGTVTCF